MKNSLKKSYLDSVGDNGGQTSGSLGGVGAQLLEGPHDHNAESRVGSSYDKHDVPFKYRKKCIHNVFCEFNIIIYYGLM